MRNNLFYFKINDRITGIDGKREEISEIYNWKIDWPIGPSIHRELSFGPQKKTFNTNQIPNDK